MTQKIKDFVKKEAVLCIAALCALATLFLVPPDAVYLQYIDLQVLCLLLCLMAVVAGFGQVGVFSYLTAQLLRRIRSGRLLGVTLVLLPFFCAMLVTNDVALLVFVPFTLALLGQLGFQKATVPVIVLQTVAANLGSMATPVGNPQNLFLYAAYQLQAGPFFAVVLPPALLSLLVLTLCALPLLPRSLPEQKQQRAAIASPRQLLLYAGLFALCLCTVFRLVPYPITTAVVVAVLFFTRRSLLKEVDYALLATFVCFFIVSGNLGRLEGVRSTLQYLLRQNTLLTAVGASQIISNVPAAVLLQGFTDNWQALLAGVNIGGLGTPIASLASLITLKLYLQQKGARIGRFLWVFTVANLLFLALLLGAALVQ